MYHPHFDWIPMTHKQCHPLSKPMKKNENEEIVIPHDTTHRVRKERKRGSISYISHIVQLSFYHGLIPELEGEASKDKAENDKGIEQTLPSGRFEAAES